MNRIAKTLMFVVIGLVGFFACAVAVLWWGLASMGGSEVVSRQRSPDGRFDAILVEGSGGAMDSFAYVVYIDKAGSQPNHEIAVLDSASRSQYARGANLRWTKDHELSVEYLKADRATLKDPTPTIAGQLFRVQLTPGIEDPSAPSGPMMSRKAD